MIQPNAHNVDQGGNDEGGLGSDNGSESTKLVNFLCTDDPQGNGVAEETIIVQVKKMRVCCVMFLYVLFFCLVGCP